jgi:hypothetical protein
METIPSCDTVHSRKNKKKFGSSSLDFSELARDSYLVFDFASRL